MATRLVYAILLTAPHWSLTTAFFRFSCGILVTERVDPLLAKGEVFNHAHAISGGSNFSPSSTTDDLLASDCTSCMVEQDLSAYWTNTLAFMYKNGSVSFLPYGERAIYYRQMDGIENFDGFKDGFAMISGDSDRRTYDASDPAQEAISFTCLPGYTANSGSAVDSPGIPTQKCAGGIRGNVNFPSCWNGDATSSDGKSHVTFSNGACPKNFPHRIPSILLETVWLTSEFDAIRDQAMDPDQPYVFSTGDTTGYSLHADFQHGWDNDVLTKAMKQCTNENFDPSGCSPLSIGSNGQCFRSGDTNELLLSLTTEAGPSLGGLPGNNRVAGSNERMKQKRDSQEVHLCDDVQVYQGTEKNYAGCGTLVKPDGSDTSGSSNTPNNSPSVTPTTTKDKPTPSKSRDKEDEEDDDDESDGDMDEHASSSESSSDSAASSAVEVTQSEVESLGSSDTIEDNSSADDVGVPEIDSSALPRTTLAGNNASWALAVTLAWLVALNPS